MLFVHYIVTCTAYSIISYTECTSLYSGDCYLLAPLEPCRRGSVHGGGERAKVPACQRLQECLQFHHSPPAQECGLAEGEAPEVSTVYKPAGCPPSVGHLLGCWLTGNSLSIKTLAGPWSALTHLVALAVLPGNGSA